MPINAEDYLYNVYRVGDRRIFSTPRSNDTRLRSIMQNRVFLYLDFWSMISHDGLFYIEITSKSREAFQENEARSIADYKDGSLSIDPLFMEDAEAPYHQLAGQLLLNTLHKTESALKRIAMQEGRIKRGKN